MAYPRRYSERFQECTAFAQGMTDQMPCKKKPLSLTCLVFLTALLYYAMSLDSEHRQYHTPSGQSGLHAVSCAYRKRFLCFTLLHIC